MDVTKRKVSKSAQTPKEMGTWRAFFSFRGVPPWRCQFTLSGNGRMSRFCDLHFILNN